jgi:hypothetical protein
LSFLSLYTVITVDVQSTDIGCSHANLFRWSQTQTRSSFWSHSALFLITSFEAPTQIIFHIMLRQTVLVIWGFLFSFYILMFLGICSGLVIEALRKRHIELIGRNVSKHQTRCILLCIRSLLQAFHTSSGYLYSFYTHCTDQHTVIFVTNC